MIVVSDTTAITSLLQIGRCELLAMLHREVLIPQAVHQELLLAHPTLPEFLRVEFARKAPKFSACKRNSTSVRPKPSCWPREQTADLLLIDESEGR